MKATELRIGNLINKKELQMTVENIGENGINYYHGAEFDNPTSDYDEWEILSGIPLTEEWLLKFGFKENDFCFILGTLNLYTSQHGAWDYYAGCGNERQWVTSIRYIHQLQNLFFAITGKELTIKEKALA